MARTDPLAPPPIAPISTPSTATGGGHMVMLAQKIALAGMSNMAASTITNPFDLVKVRQQLAAENTSTNWARTLKEMVRKEGILAIYKGLSASMLRETFYSGIRMGAYDACKATTLKVLPWAEEGTFSTKLTAGMASGMIGAAVANPADMAPGATGTLRWHARDILQRRGIAGMYRAIGPTVVRAGILTSAQLGTYDQAKTVLIRDFSETFQEGFKTHMVASGIAGFSCSVVSNPVDVVKVRMMSDSQGRYRNALHCVALVIKNDGPLAFYRGFSMCFARLFPHSLLSLIFFEQLRSLTGLAPI